MRMMRRGTRPHFFDLINRRLLNTLLMRDIKLNSHKGHRQCSMLPCSIVHGTNTVYDTLRLAHLLTWLIAGWGSLAFRARYTPTSSSLL